MPVKKSNSVATKKPAAKNKTNGKSHEQDNAPDAITLLKNDHNLVESLFSQFKDAKTSRQKEKLAGQICLELTVHTIIEEEIFYPACQKAGVDDDLMNESYVEHDGAKMLIAEIAAGGASDPFYAAKVQVLSEEIEHHVREEERFLTGMFSKAKRTDLDMDALGLQMFARKQDLKNRFKKSGLPIQETRTLIGAKLKHGKPVAIRGKKKEA